MEINAHQWINTSYLRSDGKEEFRERKQFGNRHVVFDKDSQWGEVHEDQHNATDFPKGTLDHATNYVEEKVGIPKNLAAIGITLASLYVGYKAVKYLGKNLKL